MFEWLKLKIDTHKFMFLSFKPIHVDTYTYVTVW